MKIAHIHPVEQLESTPKTGYYLLLTHLAMKYPEYIEFWNKQEGYKILDNSLIELGYALPLSDVMAMAEEVNADEIVLPDVFKDMDETVRVVNNSVSQIVLNKKYPLPYKIQVVAQGSTDVEWRKCWDLFNRVPEIDCIAIPKVTETLFAEGRPEAVRYALANNKGGKEIHLLGCWSDINELNEYSPSEKKQIRGMDTSLVYHCSVEGQRFLQGETKKPDYKIDLEATGDKIGMKTLTQNTRIANFLAS